MCYIFVYHKLLFPIAQHIQFKLPWHDIAYLCWKCC